MVRMIAAAAGLMVAGSALAGIDGRGFSWSEVDNGGIADGSGANLSGTRTFDLFFNAGSEAAAVNGFNMGAANNPGLAPYRIFTDGSVFNHSFGNDLAPNPAFFGAFPALQFDTYLAMGSATVSTVGGSVNLTGAGGQFFGTWFTQPPVNVAAGGSLFVGRFTVSDTASFLGGEGSAIEVGFVGSEAVFSIGNAIPTPGAFALMGLGGLVAARRRR